jgi:hypothetical protein
MGIPAQWYGSHAPLRRFHFRRPLCRRGVSAIRQSFPATQHHPTI